MLLFRFALNPLLYRTDRYIKGIQINHRQRNTAVIAYADDVTVFLTDPSDMDVVVDILMQYMNATGALINVQKSTVLTIGTWDTTRTVMDTPYRQDAKIPGVRSASSIARQMLLSWSTVVPNIKMYGTRSASQNTLSSAGDTVCKSFLSPKLWYMAQVFPNTKSVKCVVTIAVLWYIWQVDICRVPVSTLHLQPTNGGMGLIHVELQSRTLFLVRCWRQYKTVGSLTANCFDVWTDFMGIVNPPNLQAAPRKCKYVRVFRGEWSYVLKPEQGEKPDLSREGSEASYSGTATDEDYDKHTVRLASCMGKYQQTLPTGRPTFDMVPLSA
jgi:hypothetical protein